VFPADKLRHYIAHSGALLTGMGVVDGGGVAAMDADSPTGAIDRVAGQTRQAALIQAD
jgi:hypothetical protein